MTLTTEEYMRLGETTHVGFSDESNWTTGRYRSLGFVTMPMTSLAICERELKTIIAESGMKEFKWKRCGSARERLGAIKLVRFAIDQACKGNFRVDVLTWDTHDARHAIFMRDDIANLQRMYYHLFKNTLNKRWPSGALWSLFPDEHTALDWNTLFDCVMFSASRSSQEQIDGWTRFRTRWQFKLKDIKQVASNKYPFLQLADLFAGVAVFSREKHCEYQEWLESCSGQLGLFRRDINPKKHSNSLKERMRILQELETLCSRANLCVSLRTSRGLQTYNPKNPINFWLYKPQNKQDKAPTRERVNAASH